MTLTVRSGLPSLSADEAAHARRVAAALHAAIAAAGGWLSFEAFMELVLYAPGLGYYSAGSRKLGAGGDFVTAPEMSALFGRCVARACQPLLAEGGEVLELGAGSGALAATLLEEWHALGTLPERYSILEVSAELAARQRARLGTLPGPLRERVTWLERLPDRPLAGVILANEVADALPCRRLRVQGDGLAELGVVAEGEGVAPASAAPARPLMAAWTALRKALPVLPEGYTTEVCLRLRPWLQSLAAVLGRGALLLFDYGLPRAHYYHPQRREGTLRCHFRQRAHEDPYVNLGLQDITAWVDFSAAAEAGAAAGLEVAGYCTQTAFLLGSGIESLIAQAADGAQRARLAGEGRRLLMPEEMGEAFKALALTRDPPAELPGFGLQDLRHQL